MESTSHSQPILEVDIQLMLWEQRRDKFSLMVPNYTPMGWFECDMFGLTKAGYWYEWEIKTSAADFRADTNKCFSRRYDRQTGQWVPGRRKYDLLRLDSQYGPSRFWFVLPANLGWIEPMVPPWAGLLLVDWTNPKYNGLQFNELRKAPKRKVPKCGQNVIDHARSVCYWRFWHERQKRARLHRDYRKIQEANSGIEDSPN